MRKILLALLIFLAPAFALCQVGTPVLNPSGPIAAGGNFPLLITGNVIMASDANRTLVYPETVAYSFNVTSTVSLSTMRDVVGPLLQGYYTIKNLTTGGQAIRVIGVTGSAAIIANGQSASIYCDGSNYENLSPPLPANSTFSSVTVTGTTTTNALSANSFATGGSLGFSCTGVNCYRVGYYGNGSTIGFTSDYDNGQLAPFAASNFNTQGGVVFWSAKPFEAGSYGDAILSRCGVNKLCVGNGSSTGNIVGKLSTFLSGVTPPSGTDSANTGALLWGTDGKFYADTGGTWGALPLGSSGTIAVGTVNTLSSGSAATVYNRGTASAAILDFGLPAGVGGGEPDAGRVLYESKVGIFPASGAIITPIQALLGNGAAVTTLPLTRSGPLKSVTMYVNAPSVGDTYTFYQVNLVSANTSSPQTNTFSAPLASFTVTVPGGATTGNLTWNAGSDFPNLFVQGGQYFVVVAGAANAVDNVRAVSAYGAPGLSYYYGTYSTTAPTIFRADGFAQTSVLDVLLTTGVQYAGTTDIAAAKTAVLQNVARVRTELAHETFAGNALSADWIPQSGCSWTQTAGALTSPSSGQGWPCYILFNRYYTIEQRTENITFTCTTAPCVIGVGSVRKGVNGPQQYSPTGGGANGSMITVDGSAGNLVINQPIYSQAGEGAAPTPIGSSTSTTAIAGGLVTGRAYTLTWTMVQRQLAVTLVDSVSTASTVATTGNNATDDASGGSAGSFGCFCDFPEIAAVSGQFTVSNFAVFANAVNPSVLFVGDSLTKCYGQLLSACWVDRIGSTLKGGYLKAARSGGQTGGALAQMTSEVGPLAPGKVVLLISTNDLGQYTNGPDYGQGPNQSYPSAAANLAAIKAYCAANFIPLYIGALSPRVGFGTGSGGPLVAFQAYNTYIRSLGLPVINFDLAVSVNNNGIDYDSSKMIDGLHPNAAGELSFIQRASYDLPFLTGIPIP